MVLGLEIPRLRFNHPRAYPLRFPMTVANVDAVGSPRFFTETVLPLNIMDV